MDVFDLRNKLIEDYGAYVGSFIRIKDVRIEDEVRRSIDDGLLWPDPLIQLNPSFEAGDRIDELVEEGILHDECAQIFRAGKDSGNSGTTLKLHRHQSEAVRTAHDGHNYVLTTGTGSGKSLTYIIPIVDHILRRAPGKGIQAIVVYPMNALANSQYGELTKFLNDGYPDGKGPVTFARYTGQESDEERQKIKANPPDILLTNYVMLELILTRYDERPLVRQAQDLGFLVFDELHTYRGRQGADVALLIRRTRELLAAEKLRCVGTSATLAGSGTYDEQRAEISRVATRLFGAEVRPENVIGETLRRATPDEDLEDPSFVPELTTRLQHEGRKPPTDYGEFVRDPLSIWVESTFGVTTEEDTDRLIRTTPISLRTLDKEQEAIEQGYEEVEDVPDESISGVRKKEQRHKALESSSDLEHARLIYDAWCAAFVWPKKEGAPEAITHEVFAGLTHSPNALPPESQKEVERIRERYNFFHWHLAFPNVFDGRGGFDVVLGNPPWEMVETLDLMSPEEQRETHDIQAFISNSGRFPLTGAGRRNLYALFTEAVLSLVCISARVGIIVPTGIVTDKPSETICRYLVTESKIASLYDFENQGRYFPNVHRQYKFCLLTLRGPSNHRLPSEYGFFLDTPADAGDKARVWILSADSIAEMSPARFSVPVLRRNRDAKIADTAYANGITLHELNTREESKISSGLIYNADKRSRALKLDLRDATSMGDDSHWVRVFEGTYFHSFDHRFAYAEGSEVKRSTHRPKENPSWIPWTDSVMPAKEGLARWNEVFHVPEWYLALRRQARAADEMTAISAILPKSVAEGSVSCLYGDNLTAEVGALLCANFNSYAFNYVVRLRQGGPNLGKSIYEQIPLAPLYSTNDRDALQEARKGMISDALELTYTAWDLEPFARDLGYDDPPFLWDPERRFLLRCELDAAFFHLYGIGRDDVDYIMETFPIVKRKDEAAHGEYRTKRVILEIYEQMARAAETDQPYQTPLDPPPVDLDLPASEPATVTPLRPRTQPEPSPPQEIAAEDRGDYSTPTQQEAGDPDRDQTEALADAILKNADFSQLPPEHRGAHQPTLAEEQQPNLLGESDAGTSAERPTPEVPNPYEATLALNTCLPDGEKVEHGVLLQDAARELGHQKLTRKVRSVLNKALNAEHNAGRLKTDWKLVWKLGKK